MFKRAKVDDLEFSFDDNLDVVIVGDHRRNTSVRLSPEQVRWLADNMGLTAKYAMLAVAEADKEIMSLKRELEFARSVNRELNESMKTKTQALDAALRDNEDAEKALAALRGALQTEVDRNIEAEHVQAHNDMRDDLFKRVEGLERWKNSVQPIISFMERDAAQRARIDAVLGKAHPISPDHEPGGEF